MVVRVFQKAFINTLFEGAYNFFLTNFFKFQKFQHQLIIEILIEASKIQLGI